MALRNVTLEMSLKPFKSMDETFVRQVCTQIFEQWAALAKHAEMVSVMLWTADGSEILDYRGAMDDEIEWARYIGGANPPKQPIANDPEGKALHSRWYYYMDNPPVIRYRDLRRIAAALKEIGRAKTGKPIRVGATFDPGPEFAKSSFKYERHPEGVLSQTMGEIQRGFYGCIAVLHGDERAYAGFPNGIPEGTTLGMFLGRQSQHFLADMGFDYLWLSNGFGFGTETWRVCGSLFDGERFHDEQIHELPKRVLGFWRDFRNECPEFLIETRGTNLPTGIDLSTDAVALKDIYQGKFNMVAPPNSPWAAMDGDFGLELAAYMSHIAMLPADHEHFPFRFYVHDPWWLNSPWLDRYARQSHDIYLPMSVARLTADNAVQCADAVEFLTIDNSLGEMPDICPNEVMPRILEGLHDQPDAPGPLVWVYPLSDYQQMVFESAGTLEEVFFGDWYIREAINQGLPLHTVVLSDYFIRHVEKETATYKNSVLVSIVPKQGSALAAAIKRWIQQGGDVLFYGPVRGGDPELLDMLNVQTAATLAGEMTLNIHRSADTLTNGQWPQQLHHRALLSGHGIHAVLRDPNDGATSLWASVEQNGQKRAYALTRQMPNGAHLGWVRGTNGSRAEKGMHFLKIDDPAAYFNTGMLARWLLRDFGYRLEKIKTDAATRGGMVTISRCRNAFYFSGYQPNLTVEERFAFPWGAPLLLDTETVLQDGTSSYRFERSWRYECRAFVQQCQGALSCLEVCSVEMGIRQRILVKGLQNATLRFFAEPGSEPHIRFLADPVWPFLTGHFLQAAPQETRWGCYYELQHLNGELLISW